LLKLIQKIVWRYISQTNVWVEIVKTNYRGSKYFIVSAFTQNIHKTYTKHLYKNIVFDKKLTYCVYGLLWDVPTKLPHV